ncbi:uncharacterized protein V1518DRAFT_117400 [Limtongia smithiae]|uniref:uncharacterized protein n=1 Tax=Limtongia smithiae TaxID=1125753 RepID=UPI0034CE6CE9
MTGACSARLRLVHLTLAVAHLLLPAAAWTTSFNISDAYYLQTSDNYFYRTALSSSVALANSSLYTNINSGALEELKAPPANSSVALGGDGNIYAFHGYCGSDLKVARYDTDVDSWSTLNVSSSYTPLYHVGSVIFTDETAGSLIYVFGGACHFSNSSSSTFYNDLTAFDYSTSQFTDPANTNPPIALCNSTSVSTNGSSILIGGVAAAGWVGMTQIAVWEDDSWTYKTAGVDSDTTIDSRTGAIAVVNDLGTAAVISGGSVDGRAADPALLKLTIGEGSEWTWAEPSMSGDYPDLIGAVMLPGNILLGLTNTTSRQLVLLNTTTWTYTETYTQQTLTTALQLALAAKRASNEAHDSDSVAHSSLSKGSIAAISTTSVVAGILLLIVLRFFYIRAREKRRRRRPIGSLSPDSSEGVFLPERFDEQPISDGLDDTASVTTWEEKRRTWLKKYSNVATEDPTSDVLVTPPASVYSGTAPKTRHSDSLSHARISSYSAVSEPLQDISDNNSMTSVSSRKKLFGGISTRNSIKSVRSSLRVSSSGGPTRTSTLTGGSMIGFRRRSSGHQRVRSGAYTGLGITTLNENRMSSGTFVDENGDDNLDNYFKDRDVHVLISTRRRGQLRITNPDDQDDEGVAGYEDDSTVGDRASFRTAISKSPSVEDLDQPARMKSVKSVSSQARWLVHEENEK